MTTEEKVNYILDNMPRTKKDNKLFLLIYWQLYDNIDIPESLIKDIMNHGTYPETISRAKRKVMLSRREQMRTDLEDKIESLKED